MTETKQTTSNKKGIHRKIVGKVIRTKTAKTIVVEVVRLIQHRLYKKVIRRRKRFMVHDELGRAKLGNQVRICESRPISKKKSWRLLEIISN